MQWAWDDRCCWTEGPCPLKETLAAFCTFLSAPFNLRQLLFRIYVSAAGNTNTMVSYYFQWRDFLTRCGDRTRSHDWQLYFRKITGVAQNQSSAWWHGIHEQCKGLHNTSWSWWKIFCHNTLQNDEPSALHRTTLAFKPLLQLRLFSSRFQARASTRVKGTSGALIEAVKQYLNLRISLAYYVIAQSPYALSVVQKIKYTD